MRILHEELDSYYRYDFIQYLGHSYHISLQLLDEVLTQLNELEVLSSNYEDSEDLNNKEAILVPHDVIITHFYDTVHNAMRYAPEEHYKWVMGALCHANPEVFMHPFRGLYRAVFNKLEWDILTILPQSCHMEVYNWVYRDKNNMFRCPPKENFIFNPETCSDWARYYKDILQWNELGFFYLYGDIHYTIPMHYNDDIFNYIRKGFQQNDFGGYKQGDIEQLESLMRECNIPFKKVDVVRPITLWSSVNQPSDHEITLCI